MAFVISHPIMKAQVRMEPGGRALDTSGMAETPPGSSYKGNLAGKAENAEGHVRSGVGKAMDAVREIVNSEKE